MPPLTAVWAGFARVDAALQRLGPENHPATRCEAHAERREPRGHQRVQAAAESDAAAAGLYDPPMRRPWGIAVVAALAGCGAAQLPPPDPRCSEPGAITRVAGGGSGPLISECVRRATGDVDLQNVGAAVSGAADALAARGDARALGFLIGSTRRGTGTSGVQAELVNRVEAVARNMPASDDAALRQGIADGEARG